MVNLSALMHFSFSTVKFWFLLSSLPPQALQSVCMLGSVKLALYFSPPAAMLIYWDLSIQCSLNVQDLGDNEWIVPGGGGLDEQRVTLMTCSFVDMPPLLGQRANCRKYSDHWC